MGRIGRLVESRIWPSEDEWPEEITSLTAAIRQAGTSLGPAGERAKGERDRRAVTLKHLLHTYDPTYVLSSMAQRAMFDKDISRDWYAIHGLHALVEYAVGLAHANSASGRKKEEPSAEKIQEAFNLVAEIFALDWFLVQYSMDPSQPQIISRTQNLLRMERLLDRYQGYHAHLAIILKKTFGRIENHVISELGWNPATLPEICFAAGNIVQARLDAFDPPSHQKLVRARAQGGKTFQHAIWAFLKDHYEWSRELFNISVPELAAALGWSEGPVRRALHDLALMPGSQPDFLLPTQDNLARLYSILPLDNDQYFIWSPGSLVQESHAWFDNLLQKRQLHTLRTRYLYARDSATEELTIESMRSIFGPGRVFGNVLYDAEGRPDVDCAVKVPRDALIVECKAHSLTAPGRRGAPKRISTKLEELVTKPSKQAARFADHLRRGGTIFDNNGGRLSFPVDQQAILPRMVITYERVDPLISSAAMLGTGSDKEPAWVLPLTDLLVAADLLPSPSAFWYYAVTRWQQSQEQRLSVPAEVDILGLLLSRIDLFRSLSEYLKSEARIDIGPSGQEINTYYARSLPMLTSNPKKPVIAIPPLVVDSLDRMLKADDDHWKEAVAAVMSEPNKTWAKLRSVQRKFRSAKQPRRARIATINTALAVWIERGQDGEFRIDVSFDAS